MKKRIKLTPFWDLYMIRRHKWEETHSNNDTLAMLEAYGVYKGVGGKKEFNIDKVEFVSDKAKNNAKIIYDMYIDMISDYIYFFDKVVSCDFTYKAKARELCGRKYRSLVILRNDARDLDEIEGAIVRFMSPKLNESVEKLSSIIESAKEIYRKTY